MTTNMNFLRAYDNGGETTDRYLIIMDTGDSWTMSDNADMPNGVC